VAKLLKRFAAPWNPGYGYAFQRPFKLGPEWYVFGYSKGLEISSTDPIIKREERAMTLWRDAYGLPDAPYKPGDMRDVYPFNWVSSVHLKRPFKLEGKAWTLEDWIVAHPQYGTLTPMGRDRWLWSVREEQRSHIRNLLQPTGLFLALLPENFGKNPED
jgi:hypothetical protein